MDLLEDDEGEGEGEGEGEEIRAFSSLEDALSHLTDKGCVIEKLAAMKKTLPF